MVNEKQILFDIRKISSKSASFPEAVKELSALLERGLGGVVRLIGVPDNNSDEGPSIASHAERFFDETEGLTYRSLYTVSLRANGRGLGKVVAFFASGCSHQGVAQRLANFSGEQLGLLLERIRVSEERETVESVAVAEQPKPRQPSSWMKNFKLRDAPPLWIAIARSK
jgi:hypothetical protein